MTFDRSTYAALILPAVQTLTMPCIAVALTTVTWRSVTPVSAFFAHFSNRFLLHLHLCYFYEVIACRTLCFLFLFQVGVHIADVSYFICPGTALDREAANRGNTVYLIDQRIDMVPDLLSSNLCSLRSDVDR